MIDSPIPEVLAAEFDVLMVRAGLTLSGDQRVSVLTAYSEFRSQLRLLHGPRDHLAEPSSVFSVARQIGVEDADK